DRVRDLRGGAQVGDDLGFDSFFVGDHPAWGVESWMHLTAVAMKTKHVRLGSLVNCVSYRHPVMTARLAADLDNLSQGRLILGLGAGWDSNEYANLGLPFRSAPERQAMLEEAITIMRGVWGEEPYSFHGRYYQSDNARVA